MRQPSWEPSLQNMKPSAAAICHPLKLTPNRQESISEMALQRRRRMMSAQAPAAAADMSSETRLVVRPSLKLSLNLILQPASPLIVS